MPKDTLGLKKKKKKKKKIKKKFAKKGLLHVYGVLVAAVTNARPTSGGVVGRAVVAGWSQLRPTRGAVYRGP